MTVTLGTVTESNTASGTTVNGTLNSGALSNLAVRGVAFGGRSQANVGVSFAGIFGSITVNADGSWSYVLNNADRDTNLLDSGEVAVERFTITYELGGVTRTELIVLNVQGLDETGQIVQHISSPIRLFDDFAVTYTERLRSSAAEALLVDYSVSSRLTLQNQGSIRASNGESFGAVALSLSQGIFLNDGRITTVNTRAGGSATGALSWHGSINNGVIHATSSLSNIGSGATARAVGWATGSSINNGLVEAFSDAEAMGVWVQEAVDFTNNGLIIASGGNPFDPYGVIGFRSGASVGSHIINNGTVMAVSNNAAAQTVGFSFFPSSTNPYSAMWFTNTGTIVARTAFVAVEGYNVATHFTNSGQIEGAVLMDGGVNVFTNTATGTIDGRVALGRENDLVINAGTLTQSLNLGARGDLYRASGNGAVLGTIFGDGGADALLGGTMADRLDGGADNDLLFGSAGADMLTGGSGNDIFLYTASSDSTVSAQDIITDFVSGADRIDIGALGATGFTLTPSGAQTILSVTTANGTLSVAITGTVVNSDIHNVAPTSQVTGGGGADILIASAGGATLSGGNGNDTLVGGAGADTLDGGGDADDMFGGAGNDVYIVDSNLDRIAEAADEGIDEVRIFAGYTMQANIENAVLMGNDYIGVAGNSLANDIRGNNAANFITAGGGDDVITGGFGGDYIHVGSGNTRLIYNSVADSTGNGWDMVDQFRHGSTKIDLSALDVISFTFAGHADEYFFYDGPHMFYAQYITGWTDVSILTTSGTMFLRISGQVDLTDFIWNRAAGSTATLNGDVTNDNLGGTTDIDVLRGYAGNDVLQGYSGDDRIDGGQGSDTASYAAAAIGVAVDLRITGAQDTLGAGLDTLVDIENLLGSAHNDVLIGNAAANQFDGGTGNDSMHGGAGDDLYRVDSQSDLIFEDLGGGDDSVLASASYYLFDNVENLSMLSTGGTPSTDGHYFAVGSSLANRIVANGGNNLVIGGAGNDAIEGLNGSDSLFGDDGDDAMRGGFGIDYLVGGAGNDRLEGNSAADALYGGDGDDILYADSAAEQGDTIGTGMNIYYQEDFVTDILVGGAGNDTLYGNSGLADYDLLDGGSGNDTYYVDTGDDLTFEATGGGLDTVYADVNVANAGVYLYANVENLVLLGTTAFGVGNELDNQLTGSASGNWLLGGAGNDRLNGMAGNDVLFGEAGSDVFVFGTGNGADVIGDFTRGQDRIDLSAYGITFAQLQAGFTQAGTDGAIHLGNGNLIVLHNVTMGQLTASDFILTPVAEGPPKTEADVMDVAGAFDEGGSASLVFADVPYVDSGLERWGQLQGGFFV